MMDAGKMLTKSMTRRLSARGGGHKFSVDGGGNGGSGTSNGGRHFPRNTLANSRNWQRCTRKSHYRAGRQTLPRRQISNNNNIVEKQQQEQQQLEKEEEENLINGYRSGTQNGHQDMSVLFGRRGNRDVHDAIVGRFGHVQKKIPSKCLQDLFNDMKFYVSKAEVDKMIQCARQSKHVGRYNAGTQYLTIGEVCFIARAFRDMQKSKSRDLIQKHHLQDQQQQKENKCPDNYEVFLGGSCNPTTWRTDTAIPELQRHGITYYNPQVSSWVPELVAQEHNAKQTACLLLYVVDSQTRSTAGMIEAAYLVASGRCVVLVAYPYKEGQMIMDEPITQSEYFDLMHGQTTLLALVKSQGVKVHTNLTSALQCTANILRNGSSNGMTADEQVTHKLRKLREVFDSFDAHRSGGISLKSVVEAYQRLTNKTIDVRSLCEYLCINQRDASATRISFDQFCVLVAEFSVDDDVVGCDAFTTTDDWFKKQSSSNVAHHNELNRPSKRTPTNPTKDCDKTCDVFLGGSRASQTWRTQVAPLLEAANVTYCEPNMLNVTTPGVAHENAVLLWKKLMDNSRVLLFHITNDARSLTSMILAAHYIGLEREVVLCIEHLPSESVEIYGEILTKQAIKDYNRGRVYLHDYAKSKQVPVFESIIDAVQCVIDKCRTLP